MHRFRATLAFVFSGGLLIFASPYVIREAYNMRLPWSVPLIAVPIYSLLSYRAFKVFWPRIVGGGKVEQKKQLKDSLKGE